MHVCRKRERQRVKNAKIDNANNWKICIQNFGSFHYFCKFSVNVKLFEKK